MWVIPDSRLFLSKVTVVSDYCVFLQSKYSARRNEVEMYLHLYDSMGKGMIAV